MQEKGWSRRDDPLMRTAEFTALTAEAPPNPECGERPDVTFRQGALWVGLGGAVGALARYVLILLLPTTATFTLVNLPWGTFLANVLGCFLIGMIAGRAHVRPFKNQRLELALTTGFCGGFTTMSSLTLEIASMLGARFPLEAFQYAILSLASSLLAVGIGFFLIAGFTRSRTAAATPSAADSSMTPTGLGSDPHDPYVDVPASPTAPEELR